jgi:GNAT superfamily N-acetyltransferase
LFHAVRYGTVLEALLGRMKYIGIVMVPYYCFEEGIYDEASPEVQNNFDDYVCSFFGPEEVKAIIESGAWGHTEGGLLSWLHEGRKCFGAKYQGQIAAFMWIQFDESNCTYGRFPLKNEEAYLYDMYTMKPFRGKGLAPYLRCQSYKVLKEMGLRKFYSYSETLNAPSVAFKKKLNAKIIRVGLYIELLNKYSWNWILREHKH